MMIDEMVEMLANRMVSDLEAHGSRRGLPRPWRQIDYSGKLNSLNEATHGRKCIAEFGCQPDGDLVFIDHVVESRESLPLEDPRFFFWWRGRLLRLRADYLGYIGETSGG